MKKGLNQWCVPVGTTTADLIRVAAEAGFDGVELLYRPDGELRPHTPLERARDIAEEASKAGIEIIGFASGTFLYENSPAHGSKAERTQAAELVEHLFATANALEAGSVLCVPGTVDETHPYDAVHKRASECLPAVAEYAEKLNVSLCLENVWNKFLLSPLEMRDLIDSVGSSHVGSYFDVGNVLPFGFPEQWIDILGSRIKRVHVKDYRRAVAGLPGMVSLGQGDVDWSVVVPALHRIGYDGYLTVEVFPGEHFLPGSLFGMSRMLDDIIAHCEGEDS